MTDDTTPSGADSSVPPTSPAAPLSYEDPASARLPETNKDAKLWGMLCHLSALAQLFGVPSFLGPLVIWLIKKNEFPFVDDQGKEALNFHLTVLIAALVLSPTVCLGIGIILLIALGIAAMVFSIMAAVKANNGVWYRYPWTLRLIK